MRELMNEITPKVVIAPQVITNNTAAEGTVINRQGYDSLCFILAQGVKADADATAAVLVEHSDESGTGFEAVPDDQLAGTEALASIAAGDLTAGCKKIAYIGDKQYVKVTLTPAGNSGNLPVACIAILGHASVRPTANPPA